MKAVMVEAFGPLGDARVREASDPWTGPGEVCIAMRAADINYPDILVMEGNYQVKPPLPFSPGKAGAGIVHAVGPPVLTAPRKENWRSAPTPPPSPRRAAARSA